MKWYSKIEKTKTTIVNCDFRTDLPTEHPADKVPDKRIDLTVDPKEYTIVVAGQR